MKFSQPTVAASCIPFWTYPSPLPHQSSWLQAKEERLRELVMVMQACMCVLTSHPSQVVWVKFLVWEVSNSNCWERRWSKRNYLLPSPQADHLLLPVSVPPPAEDWGLPSSHSSGLRTHGRQCSKQKSSLSTSNNKQCRQDFKRINMFCNDSLHTKVPHWSRLW